MGRIQSGSPGTGRPTSNLEILSPTTNYELPTTASRTYSKFRVHQVAKVVNEEEMRFLRGATGVSRNDQVDRR